MPLWQIHHPSGAYTPDDKQRFAADITGFYTQFGLPRFYVVVLFHELPEDSCFVGGEPAGKAVRITIEHIARHSQSPESRRRTGDALSGLIDPYTRDRGYYVEFHIDETPQDLWMIDGIWPPPARSAAEKLWARENRPIPY